MNPQVTYLRTAEAAKLLGIDPPTLRLWAGHYGFPVAHGQVAKCRQFLFQDVVALRSAMLTEGSVSVAVTRARTVLYGREAATAPVPAGVPALEPSLGR